VRLSHIPAGVLLLMHPAAAPAQTVWDMRSRAAVDTPSDGVHAGLARSAFEAVSATNFVPINNRAELFSIRLTDQFGFEWARAP
jgi:hypothetical protein